MINYFENIVDEVKINIFKNVETPINLALSSRSWARIAKDPYAKTEWLILHYGKAHAMFHAVRLGPSFIDVA
ncbi:13518_t:CDS:1, partial [Funneliformis mosseae]